VKRVTVGLNGDITQGEFTCILESCKTKKLNKEEGDFEQKHAKIAKKILHH
jgi:hypothetical protein